MDESPGEAIDRCRKRGYGWAETARDLGMSTMRQELAEAAAYAGMARWATTARDDAIRACVEGGCPLRVLGDATGMSHTAIVRIRDRGR